MQAVTKTLGFMVKMAVLIVLAGGFFYGTGYWNGAQDSSKMIWLLVPAFVFAVWAASYFIRGQRELSRYLDGYDEVRSRFLEEAIRLSGQSNKSS